MNDLHDIEVFRIEDQDLAKTLFVYRFNEEWSHVEI